MHSSLQCHQQHYKYSSNSGHGVYLPLLWGSQLCQKPPLCLGYGIGHFTALVSSGSRQQQLVVPLTDNSGHVLPIHFLVRAEKQNTFYLLEQYLDVIQQYSSSLGRQIPVAVITLREATHMQHLLKAYIDMSLTAFNKQNLDMQSQSSVTPQPQSAVLRQPCVGCDMGQQRQTFFVLFLTRNNVPVNLMA